jgi:O-antigen/teichoic acid export membrane protein
MSEVLKKTFSHAGIYSIGILLNSMVSFIMLPIYTRCLTPADYGVLELLEITVDVLSIIAGAGIIHGLSKYYYQYEVKRDKEELVSTLFISLILLYAGGCCVGFAFSEQISLVVYHTEKYSRFIEISFFNLFLSFLIYVPLGYLRTQQKSILFVIIGAVKLVLQLSLNIVFVVFLKKGVSGVLYSTLFTSLVVGGYLTWYTFSAVSFRYSKEKAKELFKFGYPFIFSGLGAFILTFSDRYFLNYFGDISKVGVYSLGYKFGFLLFTFPVRPLLQIWDVQRFEIVNKEGYEIVFNKFLSWFVIVTVSVALFISIVVEDVLEVMSNSVFWEASNVVPIIMIAYFFQACTDFFNFGIFYTGKTKHMAFGTLLAAIIIVILSIIMIPILGIYGAAWATVIAFFIRLVYVYFSSQVQFRIAFHLTPPFVVLNVAFVFYFLNKFVGNSYPVFNNQIYSFILSIFTMLLFFYGLIALKIITKEELYYLMSPFRHLRNKLTSVDI